MQLETWVCSLAKILWLELSFGGLSAYGRHAPQVDRTTQAEHSDLDGKVLSAESGRSGT